MALAPKNIDDLADEITSLTAAEKVKLLSRLMEAERAKVDWSVVAGIQRRHKDSPALRGEITSTVRTVRRQRRRRPSR